jgi:uncharacterized RDD family membrane protein YckC
MKSIEFVSAQNVKIEYEYATVIQRCTAALIDTAMLSLYLVIMYFIIGRAAGGNFMIIELLVLKMPFIFYHPILEYLTQGQTLGKYALGIRVVTYSGERPGLREIFTRWMFKGHFIWIGFSFVGLYLGDPFQSAQVMGTFMFFVIIHGCMGIIGLMYASVAEKKQRMGDVMAGTVIIKDKSSVRYTLKDVLSIKNQENYTPEFPGVVRFTDEDMLLIKNTIQRVRKYPNPETKKFAIELANESARLIGLTETPKKRLKFLQTLLQDYVVLTRS